MKCPHCGKEIEMTPDAKLQLFEGPQDGEVVQCVRCRGTGFQRMSFWTAAGEPLPCGYCQGKGWVRV